MLFGLRCFFDGGLCYAHETLFYWNVILLEQLNSLIVLLPRHTVLSAIPFMVPGFYVLYYYYNLRLFTNLATLKRIYYIFDPLSYIFYPPFKNLLLIQKSRFYCDFWLYE